MKRLLARFLEGSVFKKTVWAVLANIAMVISILLPETLVLADTTDVSSQTSDSVVLQGPPFSIGDNWSLDTTFSSYAPSDAVKTDNGYIAVGDFGTIIKSSDGINWKATSKFNSYHLSAIGWNGQSYIVFGAKGEFASDAEGAPSTAFLSSDGTIWSKIGYKFDEHIHGVVWGNSHFVAIGTHSVYISSDGQAWTKYSTPISPDVGWGGIIFQNDTFFIGSPDGNHILASKDGQNWASIDSSIHMYNVVWDGEKYIGVGLSIYESSDGNHWKPELNAPTGVFSAVAYNGSMIDVVGWLDHKNGKSQYVSLTSKDGSTWGIHDLSNINPSINILLPSKNGFVGIGSRAEANNPDASYSFTTQDGVNWSSKMLGTPGAFNGVAANGKRAVAVGLYGAVIYTDDGVNWYPSHPFSSKPNLFDVTWDGSKFVAVGNNGAYYSADGVYWKKATVPFDKPYGDLDTIVWTGHFFVAASQVSGTFTSKDGISWAPVSSLNFKPGGRFMNWLQSMIWDGKKVIATDSVYDWNNKSTTSKIIQTTDGIHWSDVQQLSHSSGGFADGLLITYNGSKYLIMSMYGSNTAWVSSNGLTWSKISTTGMSADTNVGFLKSFDGNFVAFNNSIGADGNKIVTYECYYTSKDGQNWTEIPIPKRHPGFEVSVDEGLKNGIKAFGRYIFVGNYGQIMTTTQLSYTYQEKPIVIKANGQVVSFTEETGLPFTHVGVVSIPLKAISEALGFKVGYRSENGLGIVSIGKFDKNKRPLKVYMYDFYSNKDYQTINGRAYVTLDTLQSVGQFNVVQNSGEIDITSP